MENKFNVIDLFAGCGGLMDGFEAEGTYDTLACVEWEKAPCETLTNRLKKTWMHPNAAEEVIRFDIQRTEELINGFRDQEYGIHKGLKKLIQNRPVHAIIGGPPCQAYSLAGRIRDEKGMKDDYRNYLFESYMRIVTCFKPNFFIFENVQGMLSAAPDGEPIINKIRRTFHSCGYEIIENFKNAVFDVSDFGIPQNRKRIIILGVSKEIYGNKASKVVEDFYKNLMSHKIYKKKTVKEAISDLPKFYPLQVEIKNKKGKFSHGPTECSVLNHIPRYHNKRDIEIFQLLAKDKTSKESIYSNIEQLQLLYTEKTGKTSSVHKYFVLPWNKQSNTIPAHLYKDGLRHIHPDPEQARSITVREAARLQSFADDFEFLGGMMSQYKMIGNAVPPQFSLILAKSLTAVFNKYKF